VGSLRQCSTFLCAALGMNRPHPLPSLRSVRDLPSRGRWAPAHFIAVLPHPEVRAVASLEGRTYSSPRPASQSGHCQRAGKRGAWPCLPSVNTWRDFRAPLGVCPEVGRSQRPLHVHSMDKTPRVLRILRDLHLVLPPQVFTCGFRPGHAAAGRRPVSGPRVPGYHTRAGGHRRSPRSRFQNPVPQERWRDYASGGNEGDKSGVKKCVG